MHRHFRDEALGTACSVHDLVVLFEGAGVHAAGQARGSIRAASTSALLLPSPAVRQLCHDLQREFLQHHAVPHPAHPRVINSGSDPGVRRGWRRRGAG